MTLAMLWANKYVRYAALAVVLVIAYFGWQQHQRNIGQTQGQQNQAQQQANQGAAQVQSDHVSTVTQITQLTNQISVLAKQVETQQTILLAIVQQRQQAAQQVAGMTPEQVTQLINQALGKPQNATDFTPDDKRRIADCFTQLPLCNKENVEYQSQIKTLEEKEQKQIEKYDVLTGYTVSLERNYTELWNEKALPKRKWYCAFLCKRKPHIDQPNPADLKPKG